VLPVGIEYLDDLGDVIGIISDDSVVTGQREILLHEIEGRDKCSFLVHHNRLFVCDVEIRVGPLHRYHGILELLVRLVIRSIAPGPGGVEHDTHVDTGFLPVDDRRDETRFGECELLDQ